MSDEKALVRVTMNLTNQDVRNAEVIQKRLKLANKASAVAAAVSISLSLYELLEKTGGELLVFHPAKPATIDKMILPGHSV